MKVYSYTNYPKLDLLIDPLIGDACLPRKKPCISGLGTLPG